MAARDGEVFACEKMQRVKRLISGAGGDTVFGEDCEK